MCVCVTVSRVLMYVTMEVSQWKKCGANQESGNIFWLLLHMQVEERESVCVGEKR